jgi:hypothetical protein
MLHTLIRLINTDLHDNKSYGNPFYPLNHGPDSAGDKVV